MAWENAKARAADLGITQSTAAFNGGVLVHTGLSVTAQSFVTADIAAKIIEAITRHGLDCWVYRDRDWLVRNDRAPHIAREQWTVGFAPMVVPDLAAHLGRLAKIVGVSGDHPAVARCEADVRRDAGNYVSAARSQAYYLDVTYPDANKGHVVAVLSQALSISPEQIATIGDMPNDVLMFKKSGLSIAMRNASPDVRQQAKQLTTSNEDERFANAMEAFVQGEREFIGKAS